MQEQRHPVKRYTCQRCGKLKIKGCYPRDNMETCTECTNKETPVRCVDCNRLKSDEDEGWIPIKAETWGSKQQYVPMTAVKFHQATLRRGWDVCCSNCRSVRQSEEDKQIHEAEKLSNKRCCADCMEWLTRNEFSNEHWSVVEWKNRKCKFCVGEPQTTEEVVPNWKQFARDPDRDRAVEQAAELISEAKEKAKRREHGIAFYNSRILWKNWKKNSRHSIATPVQSDDDRVVGGFDVVFHSAGYSETSEQEGEQRITKGKAVFMLDSDDNATDGKKPILTGHVKFNTDLRNRNGDRWRSDFTVQTDTDGNILAAVDVPLFRGKTHVVSFHCVTRRCAFPWIKHEELAENDDDPRCKVNFDNLEEAVALAKAYEQGPKAPNSWMARPQFLGNETLAQNVLEYLWFYPPKPVFFLEPGDLILYIHWCVDDGDFYFDPGSSKYILRRNEDTSSTKNPIG